MDATCAIQASIHVFSLVRKYVSRILGTYHASRAFSFVGKNKNLTNSFNCYTLYLTIRLNVKRGERVWDYKIP